MRAHVCVCVCVRAHVCVCVCACVYVYKYVSHCMPGACMCARTSHSSSITTNHKPGDGVMNPFTVLSCTQRNVLITREFEGTGTVHIPGMSQSS